MQKRSTFQNGGLSPERLRRLSSVLQRYVEHGEIAGIVALIHLHDEEAYEEAVGSMTKPLIAVATLTLVEEGKIRLYDPVDAWLPELANRMVMHDANGSPDDVYPSPRAITLHDLLTYRLGIGWGQSSLRSSLFAMTPPR